MCLPKSSIGKKALMSATGLVLFGFVIMHMLGNLQIFLGSDVLNGYAAKLQSLPELLWIARVILLTCLIFHMWIAAVLTIENRRARPVDYQMKRTVKASFASKTMMLSGSVIFFFIVYHLLHFTFGLTNPEASGLLDMKGRHDVYSMVILSFQNYKISSAYILAMFFLCVHLSHGLASAPQSLGLNNEKWAPAFKRAARALAFLIFLGNTSMPVAALVGFLKLPQGGS